VRAVFDQVTQLRQAARGGVASSSRFLPVFMTRRTKETGVTALCQRGQALPLLTIVVALAALMVLGLGRLGAVVVARAEAQTAADAAALAGAMHGRVGAEALVAANGGRIVSWEAVGQEVEVVAEVHGERARAGARRL